MNKNDRSQNTSLGIVGFGAFGQLAALHLARHFEITAYDPSPEVANVAKQLGVRRRCCKSLTTKDSLRESMALDAVHEQAISRPLSHD